MASTVTVPFQDDLLQQVDKFAVGNLRTRVDVIIEATRIYVDRKLNWQKIFLTGERIASINNLSEADVMNEIKSYRQGK
jgi:metal-responsive CopG/Arc/MetJ family transcriptional regulator